MPSRGLIPAAPIAGSVAEAVRPGATFRRTTLANGLTVVSEYMPSVRSVALGVWVRRASVHERREEMGVSHFLEHLVFKGTERRSAREIALSLESLGGSLDAFTSREHTSFQARVLDEHLPQAADVLCDLIFRPALRESDLMLERNVVLEEIAMVEDTPDDLVFELHNEALWGAHPYGYAILGTRETIGALGVEAVRALHWSAYRPQNMVVAAAGRVEHDALLEVLRHTGWEAFPGGEPEPPVVPEPVSEPPVQRHIVRDSHQTHIVLGSPSVPYSDERRYAVSLVGLMLGGGMSSRLFQRVREELGLAYSVFSFQSFHHDSGLHGVYAGTSAGTSHQALDEIFRELAGITASGFPAEEIEAGKSQLKGQLTLSLESPASRMFRVASSALYGEPFLSIDEALARIDAITPEQVQAVCADLFRPERQTVVTLGRSAEPS
ncbi:MAG TPA: pitrilysin family protein [Gemmatimonadaceae bacterium]